MSNYHIIDASQRGDLERVKYLIGIEGKEINRKDDVKNENIFEIC